MLIFILLSIPIVIVQTFKYQKPVAEKIWSTRCKKNEYVLNDCNWCWCGRNYHFECKARVCEEVDMFGHFKDTIQEIDVGMEGHGAWRSKPTSCTPGVQYRRGAVLCICDDDGNWPNPVCRDLFRILHAVEVTEKTEESTLQICTPRKFYLVGCNSCFCPLSGKLDANLCTNRTCSDGDPVLEPKYVEELRPEKKTKDAKDFQEEDAEEDIGDNDADANDLTRTDSVVSVTNELELYASCNTQKMYSMGRRKCECLTNNRLICKEHYAVTTFGTNVISSPRSKKTLCSGKIGKVIPYGCNMCKCMKNGYMYCTIKICGPQNKLQYRVNKMRPKLRSSVETPVDDVDCIPGTTYKRGCNKCFCQIEKGQKVFGCTVKACHPEDEMLNLVRDCVPNTNYRTDCKTCLCDIIDGEKQEVCLINSRCMRSMMQEIPIKSLDALNGSCDPRKVYTRDCNTCTCMPDRKIMKCTTRNCVGRTPEPIEVDIVPLQQAVREICPKGHSYKVDCNLCVCLSNGNALCTTSDCSKHLD